MAKTKSSTIVLRGEPVINEVISAGAISPGHLIQIGSAGTAVVQATANAIVRKAVALEDEVVGGEITTAYASGARVRYGIFRAGDRVRLRVVAGGEAIVIGDRLSSGLAGGVQKGTTNVVAFALEAIDNSAGGSQVFIDAEIA
jgi:hypothetical protein